MVMQVFPPRSNPRPPLPAKPGAAGGDRPSSPSHPIPDWHPPPPPDYRAYLTGAMLFDANGLPLEYFTTAQLSLERWEQVIFQLLGLRWLLMDALALGDCRFAQASCGAYSAILIRQREAYVALLAENLQQRECDPQFRPGFQQWLDQFELVQLRGDRRFRAY